MPAARAWTKVTKAGVRERSQAGDPRRDVVGLVHDRLTEEYPPSPPRSIQIDEGTLKHVLELVDQRLRRGFRKREEHEIALRQREGITRQLVQLGVDPQSIPEAPSWGPLIA